MAPVAEHVQESGYMPTIPVCRIRKCEYDDIDLFFLWKQGDLLEWKE